MNTVVTASDIHWIANKFLECSELVNKRDRLSGGLGIDAGVLVDIRRSIIVDGDASYNYFTKVLSQWINNEASNATIGNLILALKNERFNKTAGDIEREWNPRSLQTRLSQLGQASSLGWRSERNNEVWNIPARNTSFVGRDAILMSLEKYFCGESNHALIGILCGLGGLGKSSAALEFAWTRRFNYRHVYWFHSEQRVQLLDDYAALALKVGLITESDISKHKAEPEHFGQKLKGWLEQSKNYGWLAIYDNAQNYDDIYDMLPVIGGHILVTSRFSNWYEGMIFDMSKFSPKETAEYVKNILGHSISTDEIDLLGTSFDHLPLALAQVCAYIKQSSIKISQYLAMYNKNKEKWLARNALPKQLNTTSVFLTWEITMKKIAEESPLAASWLRILAVLNSDHVPHKLLKTFLKWNTIDPDEEYLDILMVLRNFSMIKIDKEKEFSSMHRLLQEVIMLKTDQEERGKTILVAFFLIASRTTHMAYRPNSSLKWIPHWEALLSCAKLLENQLIHLSSTNLSPPNPEFTEIYVESSFLLDILALLSRPEHIELENATGQVHMRNLMSILGLFFGKTSIVIADCLYELYFTLETLTDGVDVLDQAVEIYWNCQGPEHKLFWLRRDLGQVLFLQHVNYERGIQQFMHAFEQHELNYKSSDIHLWRIQDLFLPMIHSIVQSEYDYVQELVRIFEKSFQDPACVKLSITVLFICIQEENACENTILSRVLACIPTDKKGQACQIISTYTSQHWKITVLSYACLFNLQKAVKTLLDFGVDPTFSNPIMGQSALHYFLNKDGLVDKSESEECSAFCLLVDEILNRYQNETNKLPAILDAPNHKGNSPLRCIVKTGSIVELDFLLAKASQYIDLNRRDSKGQTPLAIALRNGSLEIAKKLLQYGVSATMASEHGTILHYVLSYDNIELLELVFQRIKEECTDANKCIDEWLTAEDTIEYIPLMWASYYGYTGQIEFLLKNGVNPNLKNHRGKTALTTAARGDGEMSDERKVEIVKILLDYGASATVRNDHDTILHQAVASGNREILTIIIQKIKDECKSSQNERLNEWLNAADSEGDTPLMWAAENGRLAQAEILLEIGVDIKLKNNDGETALDWAVKKNHMDVATLLRQHLYR